MLMTLLGEILKGLNLKHKVFESLNKTIVFKTLSLALLEHQILEHWGSDTSDPTSRMCHVCLSACTSEIADFQLTGCVVLMPSFDAQFCSVLAILHLEARTDVHHVAIRPGANAHRVLRFQKLCHATTINRSNVSVTRAMILLQTFACLPSVRSFYTCQESLKQFGPWAHRKQKTSLQPKEYQELSKDVASCGISFKTRLSRRAQQPKDIADRPKINADSPSLLHFQKFLHPAQAEPLSHS